MVDDFCFITVDGISLKLNLGIGVDRFFGNPESRVRAFFKDQAKGVKWICNNNSVKFLETSFKIEGYPSADQKKVIIIYPRTHPINASPENAVIYNCDGTLYKVLNVPATKSEELRNTSIKQSDFIEKYFDGVGWAKDSSGQVVTYVRVAFDRDWWEDRVLNVETGEFGECLTSGKR